MAVFPNTSHRHHQQKGKGEPMATTQPPQRSKRRSRRRHNKKGVFRKIKEVPEASMELEQEVKALTKKAQRERVQVSDVQPLRQSFQELLDQLITPSKE